MCRQYCLTELTKDMVMNNEKDQNTERIILEAAEAEFIENGYGNTKMLSIARRAGVAHSMLHYYFRSKENLFQTIISNKMKMVLPVYDDIRDKDMTFVQLLTHLRRARDNYIFKQNPRLPLFLLSEIFSDPANMELIIDIVNGGSELPLKHIESLLKAEIDAGRIRPVSFADFMITLMTLDMASLSAIYICRSQNADAALTDRLMDSYRDNNLQQLLFSLRPDGAK